MDCHLQEIQSFQAQKDALKVLSNAFRPTYPSYDDWCKKILPEIERGERILFAIISDNKQIGIFLIHCVTEFAIKTNALLIDAEFRSRGVGISTYKQLISRFRKQKKLIFAQCKTQNFIAIRLLRKVGFIKIGKLIHLTEKAEDNLVFVLILDAGVNLKEAKQTAHQVYTSPGKKIYVEETDRS